MEKNKDGFINIEACTSAKIVDSKQLKLLHINHLLNQTQTMLLIEYNPITLLLNGWIPFMSMGGEWTLFNPSHILAIYDQKDTHTIKTTIGEMIYNPEYTKKELRLCGSFKELFYNQEEIFNTWINNLKKELK